MSPPETNDDVLSELGTFITSEVAATQVAIGCLRMVAFHARLEIQSADDPEAVHLLGAGAPEGGWVATLRGVAGADVFLQDVAEGGSIHQRMTQQLVVTLFTGWDAEFQRRLAAIHGVPTGDVQADFFGDLRLLRNDIVHHRGIATPGGATRCRTVVQQPIQVGDPVFVRDDDLRQLHLRIPWARLERKPDSMR